MYIYTSYQGTNAKVADIRLVIQWRHAVAQLCRRKDTQNPIHIQRSQSIGISYIS